MLCFTFFPWELLVPFALCRLMDAEKGVWDVYGGCSAGNIV